VADINPPPEVRAHCAPMFGREVYSSGGAGAQTQLAKQALLKGSEERGGMD